MKPFMFLAMAPQQGGNPEGGLMSTLIMFALIIAIFYFLILRPQQKRQKERQKLLEALKRRQGRDIRRHVWDDRRHR